MNRLLTSTSLSNFFITGRAKKRDTYKRRFVNVTNAPGGKRRVSGGQLEGSIWDS